MTDTESTVWVSAPRRAELVVRSVDEIPDGVELSADVLAMLARGGTYCQMEPRPRAFEHWKPIIMERCPLDMSWGLGESGDQASQAHAAFAGWIWDEINDELPAGTVVVDLEYAGPTGCESAECSAVDCTLKWDVTGTTGHAWRVDVPI